MRPCQQRERASASDSLAGWLATTPAGAGSCAAEEAAAVEPYAAAPLALTSLPSFTALSTADQAAILGGTAARLFGFE